MNGNWNLKKILGLLLGIVSLICIIFSVFLEGNHIFLNIGLLGVCMDLILFIFIKREEK